MLSRSLRVRVAGLVRRSCVSFGLSRRDRFADVACRRLDLGGRLLTESASKEDSFGTFRRGRTSGAIAFATTSGATPEPSCGSLSGWNTSGRRAVDPGAWDAGFGLLGGGWVLAAAAFDAAFDAASSCCSRSTSCCFCFRSLCSWRLSRCT